MDDLIYKQTLMNAFAEYVRRSNNSDFAPTPTWNDAVEIVENLPTIEVEPERHGHWVYGEDEDGVDGYRCNKCGFFVTWDYKHSHIHFIDDYLFCPHCKARMDEVE